MEIRESFDWIHFDLIINEKLPVKIRKWEYDGF